MITTWTFLLIINFGYRDSAIINIPNFTTLNACQVQGKRILMKLNKHEDNRVNMYECIPSK